MPVPGYSVLVCSRWKMTKMRSKYSGSHADAVVLYRKDPLVLVSAHADMNSWRLLASELDGVADEVLEQLRQLGSVCFQERESILGDDRTGFFDGGFKVRECLLQNRIAVARLERFAPCP